MEERFRMPTVDIIIEKDGKIVLIRRATEPYKGKLAIPGGKVEINETVEETAVREAEEETSLKIKLKEILGIYSDVKRDPRWLTVGTVFIAEAIGGKLREGTDASKANWYKLEEINPDDLAFDHAKIIGDYKRWRGQRGTYWSTR